MYINVAIQLANLMSCNHEMFLDKKMAVATSCYTVCWWSYLRSPSFFPNVVIKKNKRNVHVFCLLLALHLPLLAWKTHTKTDACSAGDVFLKSLSNIQSCSSCKQNDSKSKSTPTGEKFVLCSHVTRYNQGSFSPWACFLIDGNVTRTLIKALISVLQEHKVMYSHVYPITVYIC